jgi:hypothetical protein
MDLGGLGTGVVMDTNLGRLETKRIKASKRHRHNMNELSILIHSKNVGVFSFHPSLYENRTI